MLTGHSSEMLSGVSLELTLDLCTLNFRIEKTEKFSLFVTLCFPADF